LVEGELVDCVVTLTGKLFANTQISCGLILFSKNRGGGHGYRARKGEVLFIKADRLGSLITGSRKQKQLAENEVERIAGVYRQFRKISAPAAEAGFAAVATLEKIRVFNYKLTPGPYVGANDQGEEDEPFEERLPRLTKLLRSQFADSAALGAEIEKQLSALVP
jgi:type I restriction enzyme M protein